MTKAITKFNVLVILLLILSHQVQAQSNFWEVFISKPFIPLTSIPEKANNIGDLLIRNIKHQHQEILTLRIEGKSEVEINKILNSRVKISGTGSISGTVYKDDGITPIDEFVSIQCYDVYGQFSGSGYATPFNNGVYKIENLAAGSYYVRTSAYRFYKDKYYNNADNWKSAELINVANGEAVTGKNFSLTRNTGSISGYVKNKNNEIIQDVFISADEAEYLSYGFTQTDTSGFYEVEGLASGNYLVHAVYSGDQDYSNSWYDNALNINDATYVPVNEPFATTNINFFLGLAGAVSGTVLKPDNDPPEANSCTITIVDENDNYINQVNVDSLGKYFIKAVPAGQYKLRLFYNLQDNYLDKWYGGSDNFENATTVTVTPPDTLKSIDFRLTPGGAISGKIIDSAHQPVQESFPVVAYNENNNLVSVGFFDGTNYIVSRLIPGKYKLKVQPYEYAPQWFNNQNNFDDADFIVVNGSDTTSNINFTLNKGCIIAGSITSKNAQPISGGTIDVYDLNHNFIKSGYVSNSYYYIEGMAPGYYKLLYNSNSSEYEDQWYNGKYSFETASLVMATSEWQATANFSIGFKGSVAGFVLDNNNKRIDGDEKIIYAMFFDAVSGEYINGRQISFTGGFEFTSFFHDYKLAFVNFYLNSSPLQDSLAVSYYGGGKSFNDPNTEIVPIAYQSTQQLNDTKMETASGSISGSVFLKDDLFTNNTNEIVCFDGEGYITKVIAHYEMYGFDGSYKIYGLRPGVYYLLIAAAFDNDVITQWYDAVSFQVNPQFIFKPKMTIPAGAKGVVVGNSETSGIDFHIDNYSGTGENIIPPASFNLEQNYPNPFNPGTIINYSVSEPGLVTIKVFDNLGREISTLVNERKETGSYQVEFNAKNLASGIYYYQMKAIDYLKTNKMVLLR